METKDALEIELEKILDLTVRANLFLNDSKYLNSPDTEEEKDAREKSRYLGLVRYSIWVLTVLEICKLFIDADNHEFNLFKFLRKLKSDYDSLGISDELDLETINAWEIKLQSEDISNTVIKLKGLRDQYYAHTDRNPDNSPVYLTPDYNSMTKLLEIAKEIVSGIKSKVYDIHQIFDTPGKILVGNLLGDLSELRKLIDEEYERKKQELNNQ